MLTKLTDAIRCATGRPRWVIIQFHTVTYTLCAHCSSEAGTAQHPRRPA